MQEETGYTWRQTALVNLGYPESARLPIISRFDPESFHTGHVELTAPFRTIDPMQKGAAKPGPKPPKDLSVTPKRKVSRKRKGI